MKRSFKLLCALAALALPVASAHAQTWPTKPIKWILSQPAGAGPDVVARINGELDRILRSPEVVERMLAMGLAAEGTGNSQAVVGFVRAEHERWAKIVKSLGIVAE